MVERTIGYFAGIEIKGYTKPDGSIGIPRPTFERILRNPKIEVITVVGPAETAPGIQQILDSGIHGTHTLKDKQIVFKPYLYHSVYLIKETEGTL